MNWLIRNFWAIVFALAPGRYEERTDGLWKFGVIYKIAFGRRKIIRVYPLPPEHVNCRCSLEYLENGTRTEGQDTLKRHQEAL